MLIIITILIAAVTNISADILSLNPPDKFIEIDPVTIKQPIKRIFVPKDSSLGKISFTLNEQTLNQPFDQYIAKTNEYIETNLNVMLKPIGSAVSKKGYLFNLYSIIQKKEEYDLQITQAYLVIKNKLYLLSYNAPKKFFVEYLSIFHTLLENAEIIKNPFDLVLEKNKYFEEKVLDLIKKEKISFEKFIQSKEILQLGKKIWKDLPNDKLISRMFELRIYCYE